MDMATVTAMDMATVMEDTATVMATEAKDPEEEMEIKKNGQKIQKPKILRLRQKRNSIELSDKKHWLWLVFFDYNAEYLLYKRKN